MVSGAEKNRKMMPLTWKKSWKVAPEIRRFWLENEGKMRPESWKFFLQIDLTESMRSGLEKEREIILLTWKKSWKVDGWKNHLNNESFQMVCFDFESG